MLFDPAGFNVPFVISIKRLLKQLWIMCILWDESFFGKLENDWQNWISEIQELIHMKIHTLR